MNKKNTIIMSAASVTAALAAVTTMAERNQIVTAPKITVFDSAAQDAITNAKSQASVRRHFPKIARTIRLDSDLRGELYTEVASCYGGLLSCGDPTWGVDDTLDTRDGDSNPDDTSSSDFSSMSNEEILNYLGVSVPEGQAADEYISTLEDLQGQVFQQDEVTAINNGGIGTPDGTSLIDSTGDEGAFHCYNNCHSACHGSRGWR